CARGSQRAGGEQAQPVAGNRPAPARTRGAMGARKGMQHDRVALECDSRPRPRLLRTPRLPALKNTEIIPQEFELLNEPANRPPQLKIDSLVHLYRNTI